MRHTISAHAGLPREESHSPFSEVLLSLKKLFAQCPRSRTAHRPHQVGFIQCQRCCAGSAGVRKTPPPFPPSRSDTGHRTSSTHTLPVLHPPFTNVCTGDFCRKDMQCQEQQSWGNHCCFWPFSLPTHWAGSQGVETQPSWGPKHRGDSTETLG